MPDCIEILDEAIKYQTPLESVGSRFKHLDDFLDFVTYAPDDVLLDLANCDDLPQVEAVTLWSMIGHRFHQPTEGSNTAREKLATQINEFYRRRV